MSPEDTFNMLSEVNRAYIDVAYHYDDIYLETTDVNEKLNAQWLSNVFWNLGIDHGDAALDAFSEIPTSTRQVILQRFEAEELGNRPGRPAFRSAQARINDRDAEEFWSRFTGRRSCSLTIEPSSIVSGQVQSVRISGLNLHGGQLKGTPTLTRIKRGGEPTRLSWTGYDTSVGSLPPGEYRYRLRYQVEHMATSTASDTDRWRDGQWWHATRSYNCVGALSIKTQLPQCADGTDNDGDGKIDFLIDPGCQSARDTSEADSCSPQTGATCQSPPNTSCSPAVRSTGTVQCDGSCSATRPTQCDVPQISCPLTLGTSGLRGRVQAIFNSTSGTCQDIVRTNTACQISWKANKGTSCSVTGPNLSRTGLPLTGTLSTTPLASTTVYTVTCKNGETTVVSKNFTCRVLDQVREN